MSQSRKAPSPEERAQIRSDIEDLIKLRGRPLSIVEIGNALNLYPVKIANILRKSTAYLVRTDSIVSLHPHRKDVA